MVKTTFNPKFKTSWKNTNPADRANNTEIAEYSGVPLKIIETGGIQILITISKEAKMDFLDPATLKKADKTIALATGKETIDLQTHQLIPIKGEWCFIFLKHLDDNEFRHEVVYYNISTKQTKVLDKVRCHINDLVVWETASGYALFVAYRCNSGQISKYDLHTLEKLGDFDLPELPDKADLCTFEGNGQTVLMVDYWNEQNENRTALIDPDTFLQATGIEEDAYNQSYMDQDGQVVLTTKRINDNAFSDTEMQILPTPDCRYNIKEMEMVDIGGGNKQLIVIVTFAQYPPDGQRNIHHQTHLLAFDAVTKKRVYDLLLCDDPENNKSVSFLIYQSQLIVSITQNRKSVNKVYDLADMEKEPLIMRDENGNEDVGYNRDHSIIRYNGNDFLMLHIYGIDNHRRYYSLSNYQRAVYMVGIEDKYNRIYKVLPYKDTTTNRELFILECEDYRAGSFKHITVLHNPAGQADSSENRESYHQPVFVTTGDQSFILIYTAHNNIKLIDTDTGRELKTYGIETQGKIRQILVSDIKGKKVLLVLSDSEIKGYYLPDLAEVGISYPVQSPNKMDVLEIEGKKLLLMDADDENLYTSELESGKPVHNPLGLIIPGSKGEELCAVHNYKVLKSGAEQQEVVLLTYTEGSESYLWYPGGEDKLIPLVIDKDMRKIISDDPDFVLVDAIATEWDGKEYIIALSHHGLITKFDRETGKRIGNVIKTGSEHENNYIKVIDSDGQKVLISAGDNTVKIWSLTDNKKIKDFRFDDEITGLEVAGQRIIVCHGQNITGIDIESSTPGAFSKLFRR